VLNLSDIIFLQTAPHSILRSMRLVYYLLSVVMIQRSGKWSKRKMRTQVAILMHDSNQFEFVFTFRLEGTCWSTVHLGVICYVPSATAGKALLFSSLLGESRSPHTSKWPTLVVALKRCMWQKNVLARIQ